MGKTKELRDPYGFIYITTNNINGKKYIGQRKFIKGWQNYLGSGIAFKNAINKYGKENFHRDIVAIAYSKEELDYLEIEWINNLNAIKSEDYYNIAEGGNSGSKFAGKTEEEMLEIRKKKSVAMKGKNNPMYGKTHTEEVRNKLSKFHKGKSHSRDARNKISMAHKGKNNPSARKVICLNDNKIFNTVKEGAEFYGCERTGIIACCRSKRKSAGKHPETGEKLVWRYYSDYIAQKEVGDYSNVA